MTVSESRRKEKASRSGMWQALDRRSLTRVVQSGVRVDKVTMRMLILWFVVLGVVRT